MATKAKTTHKAVFAVYHTMNEVKQVFKTLKRLGLSTKNFSFFQPVEGDQDFPQVQKYQIKNGAIIGAFLGAFIIGGLFLFIGYRIAMTSDTRPPLFVFGGFLGALVSIVVGGIVGAACGTLAGIGTPDPVGKRYGQLINSGGILLSVQNDDPVEGEKTLQVLKAFGGADPHIADEQSTWKTAVHENVKLVEEHLKEPTPESVGLN